MLYVSKLLNVVFHIQFTVILGHSQCSDTLSWQGLPVHMELMPVPQ